MAQFYFLPLTLSSSLGGGYSYRLCPADGVINEECFQAHPLDFVGTTSDLLYANGTRITFPSVTTRVGTSPTGSQWARSPIPSCYICDAFDTCGAPITPASGTGDVCTPMPTEATCEATIGYFGSNCTWQNSKPGVYERAQCSSKAPPDTTCKPLSGAGNEDKCKATMGSYGANCKWYSPKYCYDTPKINTPPQIWDDQVNCYGACTGAVASKINKNVCPDGTTFFPGPPGPYSGYGKGGWDWSVADKIKVPKDLKPGAYLLSWRWGE
jgi:hypothetical protein